MTSATTVASTSHFSQILRNASTLCGSTTAIIRSCDSLIRISSGASDESRSGTRSSQTCMPPSPALASSEVAHERPAPPRSWMPDDELGLEDLQRALDQQLLHERVADLDAWPLRRTGVGERLRGQHRDAADAVAAGLRAIEDDLVAGSGRLRQVDLLVPHHADAERVDQRVADIAGVEDRLAADVGQPEAVAVATDAGDDPRHHATGVLGVERAEAQRVHHGDRTSAHREDVADDAADSGRGALIGLDVRRVVVRLDLERDGVPVTDVDDAGVLADADHQVLAHLVGDVVAELAQMHLARLVGAVLAPHHRVHRQLRRRRPAAEDLVQLGVLVGLEPEVGPRLLVVRGLGRVRNGVELARGGHEQTLPAGRDRDLTGQPGVVEHQRDVGLEAAAIGLLVEVAEQERRDVLAGDASCAQARQVPSRGSGRAGLGRSRRLPGSDWRRPMPAASASLARSAITAAISSAVSSRHGTSKPESRM